MIERNYQNPIGITFKSSSALRPGASLTSILFILGKACKPKADGDLIDKLLGHNARYKTYLVRLGLTACFYTSDIIVLASRDEYPITESFQCRSRTAMNYRRRKTINVRNNLSVVLAAFSKLKGWCHTSWSSCSSVSRSSRSVCMIQLWSATRQSSTASSRSVSSWIFAMNATCSIVAHGRCSRDHSLHPPCIMVDYC